LDGQRLPQHASTAPKSGCSCPTPNIPIEQETETGDDLAVASHTSVPGPQSACVRPSPAPKAPPQSPFEWYSALRTLAGLCCQLNRKSVLISDKSNKPMYWQLHSWSVERDARQRWQLFCLPFPTTSLSYLASQTSCSIEYYLSHLRTHCCLTTGCHDSDNRTRNGQGRESDRQGGTHAA